MKKIFQKYTGFLRNIRVLHFIYNLLHRKGLAHNKYLYTYFEVNKSVYSSISHKDFMGKKAKLPWLDSFINEKDILNHPLFAHFDKSLEQQILNWNKNGFMMLEKFLDDETVDAVNADIDQLIAEKKNRF